MSEPIRYSEVSNDWNGEAAGLAPMKNGEWVKWDDYARLKYEAENAWASARTYSRLWIEAKENKERLEAKVERLCKAGNELSKFAMHNDTSSDLWIAWLAAKEDQTK